MKPSIPGLGERLQLARKESGMSQSAAASLLGVSSTTVGRWEHSQRPISDTLLERVCGIYKRPIGWFLTMEDGNLEQDSGRMGKEPATPNRPNPVATERISHETADAPAAYRSMVKMVVKRIVDRLGQRRRSPR